MKNENIYKSVKIGYATPILNCIANNMAHLIDPTFRQLELYFLGRRPYGTYTKIINFPNRIQICALNVLANSPIFSDINSKIIRDLIVSKLAPASVSAGSLPFIFIQQN